MPFVADDLGAWLIGLLADAGRKKLTTIILGTDQERALRSAATAAVRLTAQELRPHDDEQAKQVALVINQVFSQPVPAPPIAGNETVLEALQAAIVSQLAVLDDASLTGTGQSSADVLGMPGTMIAERLTANLLRQVIARAVRGGPLAPLTSQLNHDRTHLQGRRLEGMISQVLEVLASLDDTRAATPKALAQLPPPMTGFSGREDELAALVELLDPTQTAGPVLVSAVAGLAGVGKTTLTIQAGHAALNRGLFGGGVLFIDLHGYDDRHMEPAQALYALLRALGVRVEHIPPSTEERAGLYRSELAQIKNPVLVIADNVSSEAQVRPLLPGTGPHRMLVTSRHTLAGLGARLIDVTIFDEGAALELLNAALRAACPEDDRIITGRPGAVRLTRACGGLPLALQIAAALLKADTTLSVGDLADLLSDETKRLAALLYDDGGGVSAPSVAAAFELSYNRLDNVTARMFRLLSVDPVPDISAVAAAALAGLPVARARQVLANLARAHLIETAPGVGGRRWMHDLVRLYARQLSNEYAEADGWEEAVDRLLGYYLHAAAAADAHFHALPGSEVPTSFMWSDDALAWQDAEHTRLAAAVAVAAKSGRDRITMILPLLLVVYLDWRRRFDDWFGAAAFCADTARQQNEDTTPINFANAIQKVRIFEKISIASPDIADFLRGISDRHGETTAHTNLVDALQQLQRFEETLNACQDAVTVYLPTSQRTSGRNIRTELANALQQVLRFEEALNACQDATAGFRETGERRGEGTAITNLANALHEVHRFGTTIFLREGPPDHDS